VGCKRLVGARKERNGEWWLMCYEGLLMEWSNVLELDSCHSCKTLWYMLKTIDMTCILWRVIFMAYELYLNKFIKENQFWLLNIWSIRKENYFKRDLNKKKK
jgi:hypothetical protein